MVKKILHKKKNTQNENINIFDLHKNKINNKFQKSLSQKQFLTKSITKPLFYKVNNYKGRYLTIFKTQDCDKKNNVYLYKNNERSLLKKKISYNSFLL